MFVSTVSGIYMENKVNKFEAYIAGGKMSNWILTPILTCTADSIDDAKDKFVIQLIELAENDKAVKLNMVEDDE